MELPLLNDFTKTIEPLYRKYFDDFLILSICAHDQTNLQSRLQQQQPENEALYLATTQRYRKDELPILCELLALLYRNTYDFPYSDLLGEHYMQNISRGQNGQYFTPSPVCEMMTKMQAGDAVITGKSIADPASGSGRMLLAFAKTQPANYFYGAALSQTCTKMAVVNFFINGLRGEVAWMNTITNEWYGGWNIHVNGFGILPITAKEDSKLYLHLPEKKKQEPEQLLLL